MGVQTQEEPLQPGIKTSLLELVVVLQNEISSFMLGLGQFSGKHKLAGFELARVLGYWCISLAMPSHAMK